MRRCAGPAMAAIYLMLACIPAAASSLVPHKAIYEISLNTGKSGSGVVSVTGDMLAQWSETCEGWTMDYRSSFDVSFSGGPSVRILSEVSTWEASDGLSYHFTVRNKTGDEDPESIVGKAKLDGKGMGGSVELTKPRRARGRLPAGTVFPTEHSVRVLRAASAAPTVLSMVVFDGLSELKPFLINAVIGKRGRTARDAAMVPLRGKRWWPIQMAFFPYGANDATPDQEYGVRFYGNGVGDRLNIDFGDFHVKADLVRLEMGKKPTCGK